MNKRRRNNYTIRKNNINYTSKKNKIKHVKYHEREKCKNVKNKINKNISQKETWSQKKRRKYTLPIVFILIFLIIIYLYQMI